MKGQIKLMHSLDRVLVGVAALSVIAISVLDIPKAYGQACFGNCAQMERSKPVMDSGNAEAVMRRLGNQSNAYARAAAAESQRLRQSYNKYPPGATVIYEGGLGPNELSDSARIRADSRERRQDRRIERERQRDCTRLALVPPGSGGGATYARNQLGC